MTYRKVSVDREELDTAIDVLSSAAQAIRFSLFERFVYKLLILSVDVFVTSSIVIFTITPYNYQPLVAYILFISGATAIIALMLNIPLLLRAIRENTRLKRLGLDSLSKSLWKESRRGRWIDWVRQLVLVAFGFILLFILLGSSLQFSFTTQENEEAVSLAIIIILVILTSLVFGAGYLRAQRERLDLISSSKALQNALISLRRRGGTARMVSVPSELLEQAAKIEAIQIAKERKDAILQSVAFRSEGYAIAFGRDAAKQRAKLGVADRIELEDLVAQLSTDSAPHESETGAAAGEKSPDTTLRKRTKSERIELEYLVDASARNIRIVAVRHTDISSNAIAEGS